MRKDRRTDMTKLIVTFRIFCERAEKTEAYRTEYERVKHKCENRQQGVSLAVRSSVQSVSL